MPWQEVGGVDHSECVTAPAGCWWAHVHEGVLGLWIFPDELDSPYNGGSRT